MLYFIAITLCGVGVAVLARYVYKLDKALSAALDYAADSLDRRQQAGRDRDAWKMRATTAEQELSRAKRLVSSHNREHFNRSN